MVHKRFVKSHGFVQWIVLIVLLIATALIVGNMQDIRDYVRLMNYQPPASIVALADDTAMTDEARKMFYVNRPVLADRSHFGSQCSSRGEQTIVLGCYRPVDHGIYLFDVQDARLDGVEEVTAAHEMLHAAYDRLKGKERDSINSQLQTYYNEHVKDERIRSTIAAYEKSEPDDILNEMHSIFATEIGQLPEPLDNYYKRYFKDRSKVIGYANSYRQEFTSRQERVKSYDLQLLSLKDRIDRDKAGLSRRESEIESYQRRMEDYRQSNAEAYNQLVPDYNNKIDQYNELVRSVLANIQQYNRIVAERNQLAVQIKELTDSINSQPAPIDQ